MNTRSDSSINVEAQKHLQDSYKFEEEGLLDAALRECDLAIQVSPELAQAHNFRGIILEQLGAHEQALAAYQKAADLDPRFTDARQNLLEMEEEFKKQHAKLPTTKLDTCLVNGLVIGIFAVLMGGIGVTIAYFVFLDYDIPWKRYTLQLPPNEITDITHVELQPDYLYDDPTGDTIYVAARDGAIYSITLFHNEWLSVEPVPDWETDYTTDCAPNWPGAQSDSQIWDSPPVENTVRDSAGIRFEHSLAIDVRCYVLLDNGSLEIWWREHSANRISLFLYCGAPVFGLLGMLIGLLIGILIIRFRKTAKAPAT